LNQFNKKEEPNTTQNFNQFPNVETTNQTQTDLLTTILTQFQKGNINVNEVRELINVASLLQSGGINNMSDKKPEEPKNNNLNLNNHNNIN